MISIYHCLQLLPDFCIPLFFIGLDFLIAKGLYSISKIYQEWSAKEDKKEKEEKKTIDVFDPTTISLLYGLFHFKFQHNSEKKKERFHD